MTKEQDRKYERVTVPFGATPPREPVSPRNWAHPAVWTDRMLTTLLENQVRGGKWHTLYDKVFARLNLGRSAVKVVEKKGAAGVDGQDVTSFWEEYREQLGQLEQELRDETYRPAPVRRVEIPKPGGQGTRNLGIPTVRDRVVQTALVHVIEPILDHTFHDRSFGFRHQRGCHDALRCVEDLLNQGYVYVLDADLKSYFDTIPKKALLALVAEKISDGAILRLIQKFLDQEILSELKTWTPEAGVPQGAVLSPVLANAYLNPLDHLMDQRGFQMVRYADDFVVLCRSAEEAEAALAVIRQWVQAAGLTLHPEKTHIVDSRVQHFDFLGYSFRGRFRFPRAKNNVKIKDTIKKLTSRTSGDSMTKIIGRLNSVLSGWHTYFRHCFWNLYDGMDKRIRSRLRRLLLKRHRRNPKRLPRTHRWPNKFFDELGLYSLREAHIQFVKTTHY